MPSALLLDYSSGIPPRAIRTLTGRRSNKPSLRATPPCATSFLAGRQPDQPTFYRVFLRTSAPPSRRFRSLLAKAGYTPPMTPSSSDSQRPVRRAACLLKDEQVRVYGCSCAVGPCRLAIRQFLASSAPRALCECSNVFTGGLVCTSAPGGGFTNARSVKYGKPCGWRSEVHHLDSPSRRVRH